MRFLPPVHSPLPPAALPRGLAAACAGGGERRRRVEARVRRTFDPRAVLLTDSGTAALQLVLSALRSRADDVVALPAYCCYDLATAAVGASIRVRFYDLDPLTLSPEANSLERALREGAGAVVVAHLYGVPVEIVEIRGLVDRHGALLIEDAAQEASAELGGRRLGTFGSVGILSFGRGKGRTGGGGGALLAGDSSGEELVEACRERVGPGGRGVGELVSAAAQWGLARPTLYGLPSALPGLHLGETRYREPEPPEALPAASAGILDASWEASEAEVRARRRNADRLRAALRGAITPISPATPGADPGWLRLPVLLEGGETGPPSDRGTRRLGIMPGYPRVLAGLEPLRPLRADPEARFPGAERLTRELLTLPVHGLLAERDLRALEAWLRGLPG